MPLSVIEAMASGLPIAATDVGDVMPMVAEANRAFITPLDEVLLAGAIKTLAGDRMLRSHLGAANQAKAAAEFDQATMVAAYGALFDGRAPARMTTITLSRVTDWVALGERWRELETRSDCSFFQSWTWTGCLAEERFPDPVLLEATQNGRLVAMGLFNRRRDWTGREVLWLGESGSPGRDAVFIEWNGLLAETGTPVTLLADCLRAARTAPIAERRPRRSRRLVLSGIDAAGLEVARLVAGGLFVRRSMGAPFADLAGLRQTGRAYLAALSANSRYQIRRSDRDYGALTLQRAITREEALGFLDELASLHQATWRSRGRPGAFADPYFARFHRALIERGFGRGEIVLLRLASGDRTVGFLYNFEWRGGVLAYQSGFDYPAAGPHQKPGLTCHHQAIEDAAVRGLDRYDFLAGADRYKRSLATSELALHWAGLGGLNWPRHLIAWLKARARPAPVSQTS
jgi:CelD/BcsL family acetyltransferase involved in cellulose biosynthesis